MRADELVTEVRKNRKVIKELKEEILVLNNRTNGHSKGFMTSNSKILFILQELEEIKKRLPKPVIPEVVIIPKKTRVKK